MGYLRATLTQVFTRGGGADVSLRGVTIAHLGNGVRECGWRHAPEARGGFGGFWKSQAVELSWVLPREKTVGFRLLAEARIVAWWRLPHVLGSRWKSQNRKNVYLSPYVEEPLNSKVIKKFVPELRSRKCFSCFEILMFYVYMLWTFYVRFAYPSHGYGTFLRHTNNSICLQLNGFAYSQRLHSSIWSQVWTLIGTTNSGQSGPRRIGKKGTPYMTKF